MHAPDVLRYGHLTLVGTLATVPQDRWEEGGVCGVWSVKNIVAHLASYEQVLADLLAAFAAGRQQAFANPFGGAFNDEQVARRRHLSAGETLDEYQRIFARVTELAGQLPAEAFQQSGALPWYGQEYDLDDFLAYTFYGHKREHSAQIAIFADTLRGGS